MARRELLALSLYSVLASNRNGLFLVFLPLYLVEIKGAELPAALAILSFGFIPASLIGPWVGRLSDRAGRRRPFLLAGEAAALPLFLAIIFAPGYLAAGILFVAAELVLAIGTPAYTAFVADVTRSGERGFGYGLLNATSNAGSAVGFVVAGTLVFLYGLSALFPFVVAVMVATLAIVVFLVPDLPVGASPTARRSLATMKPVVTFSFAVSVRAIGSGAIAGFYGYYASRLGANGLEVSLVAVAGLATTALLGLPLGRWIDRRGEIRGILYGTLVTLASFGIFLFASTWEEIVPAQVLRSSGFALLNPGMLAWVARTAPANQRAESLGFFALVNSTLWSVGPAAGAVSYAAGGTVGLVSMAIVCAAISFVLVEWLYGRPGSRAPAGRPPRGPTLA